MSDVLSGSGGLPLGAVTCPVLRRCYERRSPQRTGPREFCEQVHPAFDGDDLAVLRAISRVVADACGCTSGGRARGGSRRPSGLVVIGRWGLIVCANAEGPSRAATDSLSHVMAADLAGTGVTVNLLAPCGAAATGMVPDDVGEDVRAGLLDQAIMGPPIRWLASADSDGITDCRVVTTDFADGIHPTAS